MVGTPGAQQISFGNVNLGVGSSPTVKRYCMVETQPGVAPGHARTVY